MIPAAVWASHDKDPNEISDPSARGEIELEADEQAAGFGEPVYALHTAATRFSLLVAFGYVMVVPSPMIQNGTPLCPGVFAFSAPMYLMPSEPLAHASSLA